MATIQPTSFPAARPGQAYTTPPNSQGYQQYPNQFSPAMDPNPNTPLNLSPASPNNVYDFPGLPLATRQLRPPKSPMFLPAALRPTERPPRLSPPTPPRSVHGSTDSLENSEGARPASRRSTADNKKKGALGNVIEDEPLINIPTEDLGEVTGPPTRNHWKPDANAPFCDTPICQRYFGLFERRHHCRLCGNIFCGQHSSFKIPLDQNADFHPNGEQCRACEYCWGQYERWKEERILGVSSTDSGEAPTANASARMTGRGSGKSPEGGKGVAASFSRDGNWSTF
ncbi:hypothetical protein MMC28_004933 [Mycoblastus sanguinarius]|nr:hypothetical protein [Mycoblastus sanguinarius]